MGAIFAFEVFRKRKNEEKSWTYLHLCDKHQYLRCEDAKLKPQMASQVRTCMICDFEAGTIKIFVPQLFRYGYLKMPAFEAWENWQSNINYPHNICSKKLNETHVTPKECSIYCFDLLNLYNSISNFVADFPQNWNSNSCRKNEVIVTYQNSAKRSLELAKEIYRLTTEILTEPDVPKLSDSRNI